MFFRRLAFAAFWIVLALYVLRDPDGAAHTTRAIGHGLAALADGLARFADAVL
jgi:hypothetical protein